MKISDDEKIIVVKQFDNLCKKALENIVKNYYKNVISRSYCDDFSENAEYSYVSDRYFHKQYVFDTEGFPIVIDNRNIAVTLKKLNAERRKIILLYYFAGFSDGDISYIMKIPRTTIQYRRAQALNDLRKLFGGKPK